MDDPHIVPLSETTNIQLLEEVIDDQTTILKTVYGDNVDVADIPQIWTLCMSTLESSGTNNNGVFQIKRWKVTMMMACVYQTTSLCFGQMIYLAMYEGIRSSQNVTGLEALVSIIM
jgi:hypothetical protein